MERNKLNAIMDGMGDAVMIVSTDYKVEYMNRIMQNTFGDNEGQQCFMVIAGKSEICPGCVKEDTVGDTTVDIESENGRFYLATQSQIYDIDGKRSV